MTFELTTPTAAPMPVIASTALPPMPGSLESFVRGIIGVHGVERLDTTDGRGESVSLVARYVQETKLAPSERTRQCELGDARRAALQVAAQLPEAFERFLSPLSTGGLPGAGAVISFKGNGPTSRFGHTAIVVAARRDGNVRSVRVLESNHDGAGAQSVVRLSDWLRIDGLSVHGRATGWCNPR